MIMTSLKVEADALEDFKSTVRFLAAGSFTSKLDQPTEKWDQLGELSNLLGLPPAQTCSSRQTFCILGKTSAGLSSKLPKFPQK